MAPGIVREMRGCGEWERGRMDGWKGGRLEDREAGRMKEWMDGWEDELEGG